jgi:hypothetical protein
MSAQIKIVPSENGTLVRTYANNAEFAYVVLESSDISFANGWIKESKRTCLLRAKTHLLNMFASQPNIPGRIHIQEYLENGIPAHVQKANLRDDVSFQEAISTFIKKAGSDGPALKIGELKILRFTQYDPTGQSVDIILQHDNVLEVEIYKQKKEGGDGANLPGGEPAPF